MTKEEIKALIATITKENTTEQVHAEVLNAIVDAMPEGGEDLVYHKENRYEDVVLTEPLKSFILNKCSAIVTQDGIFPRMTNIDEFCYQYLQSSEYSWSVQYPAFGLACSADDTFEAFVYVQDQGVDKLLYLSL